VRLVHEEGSSGLSRLGEALVQVEVASTAALFLTGSAVDEAVSPTCLAPGSQGLTRGHLITPRVIKCDQV
jgi:hypothetical protein